MRGALHGRLADAPMGERWALVAGSEAHGPDAFASDALQVIHNFTDEPWHDDAPHAHRESDEIYLVLLGVMHVDVDGARHAVKAGEFLCVPAGVVHQLVDVETPHRSFVLRAPSVRDKVTEGESHGSL